MCLKFFANENGKKQEHTEKKNLQEAVEET